MSNAVDCDIRARLGGLAGDQRRAEALLADLGTHLRRVPVEERTRALHLRAIALRHLVTRWPEEQPTEATRKALCDELVALGDEAREWRHVLVSGRQLASERSVRD